MSKPATFKAKRTVRTATSTQADIDLGPLPELAGYVLRRAQLAVFQDFWRAFAPFDIRPAQYAVLIIIERNPGLRQSQISAALNIKRANLVALLDSLESRGLAKREPVASDRRSYALHLTEQGTALMQKLAEVSASHEARIEAQIGAAGRRELLRLLHGVIDGMGPATDEDEES